MSEVPDYESRLDAFFCRVSNDESEPMQDYDELKSELHTLRHDNAFLESEVGKTHQEVRLTYDNVVVMSWKEHTAKLEEHRDRLEARLKEIEDFVAELGIALPS